MTEADVYEGCVVKMQGNKEPCVVYRIMKPEIMQGEFKVGEGVPRLVPHAYIEVMGWVPVELLEKVTQHHRNMFALDKKLWQLYR